MKRIITLCLVLTIMFLAGCSISSKPVGIGWGRNSLKKSPCACNIFYDFKKGGLLNKEEKA